MVLFTFYCEWIACLNNSHTTNVYGIRERSKVGQDTTLIFRTKRRERNSILRLRKWPDGGPEGGGIHKMTSSTLLERSLAVEGACGCL